MAERPIDVRFDRRRNSREHQLAVMPDAPRTRSGAISMSRARQHVGQDQRPRSRHGFGPAARQLQPLVERVDARVLRGDAQRLIFDVVDAVRPAAHPSSAPRAQSTPDPVPTSSTASGGPTSTASSRASRHITVVAWSPVPNAPASTSLRAPVSASELAGTVCRRPTRIGRGAGAARRNQRRAPRQAESK